MSIFDLDTSVRDWYIVAFPNDDYAYEDLNEIISFRDVLVCLIQGKDLYDLLGVSDSIIRERIFQILCGFLRVEYDDIHSLWLRMSGR